MSQDFSNRFIKTLLEDVKYCSSNIIKVANDRFNIALSNIEADTVLKHIQSNVKELFEVADLNVGNANIDTVIFGEQEELINYANLNFVPSSKILRSEGFCLDGMKRYGNHGYICFNLATGLKIDLTAQILNDALFIKSTKRMI